MLKLSCQGDLDGLERGLTLLGPEQGFVLTGTGLPVTVKRVAGRLGAGCDSRSGWIEYDERAHFFRALSLFLEAYRERKEFAVREKPQFRMVGAMFDVSRNAAMKLESFEKMMHLLALMGYNMAMLYTEDTYEIEGEPYFGYMRGRYTPEELEACDDYADIFGIELIPCIQTLGHLEQFLKWDPVKEYGDTPDILLAGAEKTYTLIAKMIAAAAKPFRSRRIHLGMDEAHAVGLGRYLDLHGYQNRFAIMFDHLNRVHRIAVEMGLSPMIWGDMPFRLGSKTGDYPDLGAAIPPETQKEIPEGLQLVYWDYMTTDKETYIKLIRQHKALGIKPIYAGGLWNWCGFATNFRRTFSTLGPALAACKEEGVEEVFVTLWNDNGAENHLFAPLPGLLYFAERCHAETPDEERLKQRFKACTGGDYDDFRRLGSLDESPVSLAGNMDSANPSKYLLWQDVLMGLFDRHVAGLEMGSHYACLAEHISGCRRRNPLWDDVFAVPEKLCGILAIKAELGLQIRAAYMEGDRVALRKIAQETLPQLIRSINELRLLHREEWFALYKPFGWEVLDIRYGGLAARLDSAARRLIDYLEGGVDRIEELEAERLFFADPAAGRAIGYSVFNRYHRIVTAGALSG